MTDHSPRLFASDADIIACAQGMIACTLPREAWTHEAHLGATCWIVRDRADIAPERDMPGLIRRYNESLGGRNTESEGYHETITQAYLAGIRAHLSERDTGEALLNCVNALLQSERGRRDWPLRFYSQDLLFSVEARLGFAAPDLAPLPNFPVDYSAFAVRLTL